MLHSPASPTGLGGATEITPLPDQWPNREDPAFVPFAASVLARNGISLREPLPVNACASRHTKPLCTYEAGDNVRLLFRWDYTAKGRVVAKTGSYDVYIPAETDGETGKFVPPTDMPYYWLPLVTPNPYLTSEANEAGEVTVRPGCTTPSEDGREIAWQPALLKSTTLDSLRWEANHMISVSIKDQKEQQVSSSKGKKGGAKTKTSSEGKKSEASGDAPSPPAPLPSPPKKKKKTDAVVDRRRETDAEAVDFEAGKKKKERAPVERVRVDDLPPGDGITRVQAPTRSRKILIEYFPERPVRSPLKLLPSDTPVQLAKATLSLPSEKVLSYRMAHPQVALVEGVPCYKLNTAPLTGLPVLVDTERHPQLAIVTDFRALVMQERDTTLFMPEQHQRVAPFLLGPANALALRSLLVWHPTGSGKSYVAAELAARWAEHTSRNLLEAMASADVKPSAKADTIMKHAVFQHFLWQGRLRREDDFPGVDREACLAAVRPVVVVTRSVGNQSGAIAQQLSGDLARVANFLGAVSQLSSNITHKDLRAVVDNVAAQTTKRTSSRTGGLAAQDKGHVLPPFLVYVTDLFNFGNSMPYFVTAEEEKKDDVAGAGASASKRRDPRDTHCWCDESAAPPLDVSLAISKAAQRMPDNPTNATFTCGRFSDWSSHSVHATGGAHLNNDNIDLISPVRKLARLLGDGVIGEEEKEDDETSEEEDSEDEEPPPPPRRRARVYRLQDFAAKSATKRKVVPKGKGKGKGKAKAKAGEDGLNAAGITVRMLKNRSDRKITTTERAALAGWAQGRGLGIGEIDWTQKEIYASQVADIVADMVRRWNPLDGCVVIVDEAHELFVRPQAPAPTALAPTMRLRRAIADARDLVYCPMTATPVQKSVSDFLCQINMLRTVEASAGPDAERPEALRLGDLVDSANFKPKPEALLKVQGYISFYETDSDRHLYAAFLPHRRKGQLLQPSTILKAPMSAEMVAAMEAANRPTVRTIRDRSRPDVFPPLSSYVARQVAVLRVGENRVRNVTVRGPAGRYAVIDSAKPGGPLRAIRIGGRPGEGKWIDKPDPDEEDDWLWKPSLEEDTGAMGWGHPSFADDEPCGYTGASKRGKPLADRERPEVLGTIQIYRKKTDTKTREELSVLDTKHTHEVFFIAEGLWVTLPGRAKTRKDQALVEALGREEDAAGAGGGSAAEAEEEETLCDRLEKAFERWIFVEDKDAIFPVRERKFVSGFIPNAKVQVPTQFYKPPTPPDVEAKVAHLMSSLRVQNYFLSVTPSWSEEHAATQRVSTSTQRLLEKAIGAPTSMLWAQGLDANHVAKLREISKVLSYCPRGKGIVFSQFPASLHALANYLVGLRGPDGQPLFEMVNPYEWADPSKIALQGLRSSQHRSPIRFALLHAFGSVSADTAPTADDIRRVARYFQTGVSTPKARQPVRDPNAHGEVLAFVLAPISVYGQSVNFRNIRTVVNMEPQASATLTIQSQGRARRDCKHSDLSYVDGEWSIQLYEAVSVLPSRYGHEDLSEGEAREDSKSDGDSGSVLTDLTSSDLSSTASPQNLLQLTEERERNAVRQALAAEAIGARDVGEKLDASRAAAQQAEEDAEVAAVEAAQESKDKDYVVEQDDDEEGASEDGLRRSTRKRRGRYDDDDEFVDESGDHLDDEELGSGKVVFLEGEKREAKQAEREAARLAAKGSNVFVEMAAKGRVLAEDADGGGGGGEGDDEDEDGDEDAKGGMVSFTLMRLIRPFLASPPLRGQMEGALSGSVLPTSSGRLLRGRLLSPDQWVWANARMDYLLQFIFQRYLALTAVDCRMVASRIPAALQPVSLTSGPKHCYEYAQDMPLTLPSAATLPDATAVVKRWFGDAAAGGSQTGFWRSWAQSITDEDVVATRFGEYGACVNNLKRKLLTSFARCTISPELARVILAAAAALTAKTSGKTTTFYYAKNGPALPPQLSQRKLWSTRLSDPNDFVSVDIMERLQDTLPKGDTLELAKAKAAPKRRKRDTYGADAVTTSDTASTVVMVFGEAAAQA